MGIWKIQKEIALHFKEVDISDKWSQRIDYFICTFYDFMVLQEYHDMIKKYSSMAYRELENHHWFS